MSWLYTIVFAGLMFSSNNSQPIFNSYNTTNSAALIAAPTDETEKFEQTYPLGANGRVSVSNVNGSITVETWDKNEVKLEYVKTADTKEELADISVKINAQPDSFNVETDYAEWKDRNYGGKRRSYSKLQIEYFLTVPRNAVLNEIETVNGTISISNTSNMTKASTVNGEVKAVNLRGTANLSSVNGTIVADFDQLQANSRISLSVVNGKVNLTIPSDASATIKADTVNGDISNDFGLPVRKGEYVGRDLYGKIGGGDVRIHLNSVNGALSVKRKNDGKNPSPAVNLLNMKNEDDWDDNDDDDEDNSAVRPPKPPKPPKNPINPRTPQIPQTPMPPLPPPDFSGLDNEAIRKSVEDAMEQAEKEMEQMGPDFEQKYAEAIRQAKNFNSDEMRARMKEIEARYKDAMTRMADGYFTAGAPPAVEKKSGSFAVKGTPKVSVEAKDCDVSVRGWDKQEVSYSVVRISRSPNGRTNSQWTTNAVKNSDSSISIKVSDEPAPRGEWTNDNSTKTRIEIFVPKKTDLKIVADGAIRLEGVSGELYLEGADEAIDVRDSDGKLSVANDDGRIRVIGFRGAFDGKTIDGVMNVEGDFQKFSAQTVDGTIVLTLPENANVNIESNRKDIVSDGVALDYQGDGQSTSKWKVGSGGSNHVFTTTEDGKIIIRAANALKTN